VSRALKSSKSGQTLSFTTLSMQILHENLILKELAMLKSHKTWLRKIYEFKIESGTMTRFWRKRFEKILSRGVEK